MLCFYNHVIIDCKRRKSDAGLLGELEDARLRPRRSRNTAVNALKRDLIREAAKRVFLARGLSAASVREIALQAGYTTGAIYFHYASKEEIYADVLSAVAGGAA